MGIIAIEGIKIFAYHGFYPEEQKIGTEYLIDVYVGIDTKVSGETDLLANTVNYESIFRIVKSQMGINSKLIETVAHRIALQIKSFFNHILSLKVKISKLNPPLGAVVARTTFEISEDYRKICASCQKQFLSHFEADCWTRYGRISEETKVVLFGKFGNNLCKNCLSPYLIKEKEEDN